MTLADLPNADAIRRMARDVLQRGDYELDAGSDIADLGDSLLVRALQWLLSGFEALAESLAFLPDVLRYPAAALLVVLATWLIYRSLRLFARGVQGLGGGGERLRDRSPRVADPEEFEALATAAGQAGSYVEAVRWLLRAALVRLERAEQRRSRPGATNREVLRRYRGTPLAPPLQTLVDTVDVHWYGDRPADQADFDGCRASYQQLNQAIAERVRPAAAPASRGSRSK